MQILTCFIFLVLFSKKTVSFTKETLQKNFVIVEEKLDGIDIDDTGILDLPSVHWWEMWESLIYVHYVTSAVAEIISSVTMWNIAS